MYKLLSETFEVYSSCVHTPVSEGFLRNGRREIVPFRIPPTPNKVLSSDFSAREIEKFVGEREVRNDGDASLDEVISP